jgi:hypothetical protein
MLASAHLAFAISSGVISGSLFRRSHYAVESAVECVWAFINLNLAGHVEEPLVLGRVSLRAWLRRFAWHERS